MSRRGYQSGADLSRTPEPEQQKPAPAVPKRPQSAPRPDPIRSTPTKPTAFQAASPPRQLKQTKRFKQPGKRLAIVSLVVIVLLGGAALLLHQSPVSDPFDAKTLAASAFPLYYPTDLPKGYHIDKKSVSIPQEGVVVFNIVGPQNQKIYMSQEARSNTFNYGGYYKQFSDLKETVTATGTIAVGRINNNETLVGSLATNKTWALINTNASVEPDEFTQILKSLAVSH